MGKLTPAVADFSLPEHLAFSPTAADTMQATEVEDTAWLEEKEAHTLMQNTCFLAGAEAATDTALF